VEKRDFEPFGLYLSALCYRIQPILLFVYCVLLISFNRLAFYNENSIAAGFICRCQSRSFM